MGSKVTKTYWMLSAFLLSAYVLIALLAFGGVPPYHFVYPPPITVTLFLFFGVLGTVLGGLFHVGLFLILNLYLLRRASKGTVFAPLRSLVPSLIVIVALLVLSAWYWLGSWSYGIKYQGILYVAIYGALNVLTFGALLVAPFRMAHRVSEARMVLIYNFCVHLAFLLVLFPYLGETP